MNRSPATTAVAAVEAIRLSSLRLDQRRHTVTHDRDTEFAACPADTVFQLADRARPRVVDADNYVLRLQTDPVSGRARLNAQDLHTKQIAVEAVAEQDFTHDGPGEAASLRPERDFLRLGYDVGRHEGHVSSLSL